MLSAFIKKSLMPKGSFIWGNAMYSPYALAFGYEPVKSSTQTLRCGFSFTPDAQSCFFKVNVSWERKKSSFSCYL